MRSAMTLAARALVTALLCGACWWLWTADHGLAHLLRLGDLDLPVRVAAIFALLSVADQISAGIDRFLSARPQNE